MSKTRIPKVFHYCWFGKGKKSELIIKCIESWKTFHPDWEIVEWNEDNYDVHKIPYISQAYNDKKWAFVADYARFDILNEYGGVFPDTDVEFFKQIPDSFLDYEGFTGFEQKETVAPGLIYGSIPGQKITQEIAKTYEKKPKYDTSETIVHIATKVFKEHGIVLDNSFQVVDGIAVFPNSVFCGFNHETQKAFISKETISIHHYAASWVPWYAKSKIRSAIIKLLVRILGERNYISIKRTLKRNG